MGYSDTKYEHPLEYNTTHKTYMHMHMHMHM